MPEVKLTMRPHPRWLRWLREVRHPNGAVVVASSQPWLWVWFAAVVPRPLRWLHRWYAAVGGFFWLPCPLCGVHFGGHEWRPVGGRLASVPDPCGPSNMSVGICPRCTRAGLGRELSWDDVTGETRDE